MKWRKSPDSLVQAFDHSLPVVDGVERGAMFGYPCAFYHGHLFCGLHQESIIVLLPEVRRDALVAEGASVFEPMPGRAMKEYVVVPAEIVAGPSRGFGALLSDALAHASSRWRFQTGEGESREEEGHGLEEERRCQEEGGVREEEGGAREEEGGAQVAMTSSLAIDPRTSALLVMDFQTAVVEMVPVDKDTLLPRTAALIEGARKAGMTGHLRRRGSFRVGYPGR